MQFVKSALESQGYRQGPDWEYRLLPDSHPIFHCYYDFPDGAPPGHILELKARQVWLRVRGDGMDPWARGIEIGGRLVALNPNQVYVVPWWGWGIDHPYFGSSLREYDPTLQFRFGINTIIFALTQEGSITHRLMESVR